MTADLVRWLPVVAALIGLLQLMFLRVRPMPDPKLIREALAVRDENDAAHVALLAKIAVDDATMTSILDTYGSFYTDPATLPLRVFVRDTSAHGYQILTPVPDTTQVPEAAPPPSTAPPG